MREHLSSSLIWSGRVVCGGSAVSHAPATASLAKVAYAFETTGEIRERPQNRGSSAAYAAGRRHMKLRTNRPFRAHSPSLRTRDP